MANPNSNPTPTLRITDNLTRVAGVLEDMQAAGKLHPMSPGIPPLAFGAGGPMYVIYSFIFTPQLFMNTSVLPFSPPISHTSLISVLGITDCHKSRDIHCSSDLFFFFLQTSTG